MIFFICIKYSFQKCTCGTIKALSKALVRLNTAKSSNFEVKFTDLNMTKRLPNNNTFKQVVSKKTSGSYFCKKFKTLGEAYILTFQF